jgi:TRAP-type uncharacterized transport system fused permease subunit
VNSYRDLAEAEAFHRRRLAAAFVSARTDDARQEPPRTVRCVVAGMLVGVVSATGVGVADLACGHPEVHWVHGGARVSP